MMRLAAWLSVPILLAAAPQDSALFAAATLNVLQADGSYKLVDTMTVPASHQIHDRLIAMEGPGWESDKVAYRLYLDERNVPDIYGKKLPGRILNRIGMGKDDYHTLADWGMDIFQVNQTLGMGGIGVMRGGKVTQLGPATITARVHDEPAQAVVSVHNKGFAGDGGPADLATRYAISQGSRVTRVNASVSGAAPQMVAGLTLHPGVEAMESKSGNWRYIATWGVQSLAEDALGIALFYPADNVTETGQNSGTYFVRFCDPHQIRYAFAAAWVQEPGAPKTAAAFRAWLDETAAEMAKAMPAGPGAGCRP
jgi:hypothetical protein